MNAQEKFWSGSFGDEYTARNRVDWRTRIPFWTDILGRTGARSVYELGCNAGWNLSAIRRADRDVAVCGHDINAQAVNQARAAGLDVTDNWGGDWKFDLVFTAGVLIHIAAPKPLLSVMNTLVESSCDYVLAVEYDTRHPDLEEEMVRYRGHEERLWRRNYGLIYANLYGLKQVATGPAGDGFDDCTYWLMRKP